MNFSNIFKWVLTILLFVSACFDIYSTFINSNFISLESNIFFLGGAKIWILIIIKLVFMGLISWVLFHPNKITKGDFAKFFYIHLAVLLISIQFYAGFNNLSIQKDITEIVNEELNETYTPSEIPTEIIEEVFTADKKMAKAAYLKLIFNLFYLPFGLALISFKLFEIIFGFEKPIKI